MDVLLPLAFFVTSWTIGHFFFQLLFHRVSFTPLLSPLFGTAIILIFTSFLYQFGIATNKLGLYIYVFSTVVLILRLSKHLNQTVLRSLLVTTRANFSLILLIITGYLLLVIPATVTGINFKVFQGNHWDALSYMGITQSVTLHSFTELTSNPNISLSDPVTTLAAASMHARPNVEILLATFLAPFKLSVLSSSYAFAVYLTLLLATSMWAFINYFSSKRLTSRARFLMVFSIVSFIVGFWGQYFIDINAWSSAAAIPLLVSIFISKSAWLKDTTFRQGIFHGIFMVAAALVYPEALLFFLPLIFMYMIFLLIKNGDMKLSKLGWNTLLYTLVLVILATSKYQPLRFGFSQLRFGSSEASAPWGSYFQAYLGGDQGLSSTSVLNFLRTVPSGILGLYFLSPTELDLASPRDAMILLVNLLFFMLVVVLFIRLLIFSRTNPIGLVVCAGILIVPALVLSSTLWTAGKALTYIIALAFCTVLIELYENVWDKKMFKSPVIVMVVVWGLLQIGFAITRIDTVYKSYSPHSFPPYVSVQNLYLKSQQDWNFPSNKGELRCDLVELDISEPFQRFYAQMALNEQSWKWYDKNPINSYFGNGANIGKMPQYSAPKLCVLQNQTGTLQKFTLFAKP